VTRLGETSPFGPCFKDPDKFLGEEIWFVVGILRVWKGFEENVLGFQVEL
jgi:hypothetical protein